MQISASNQWTEAVDTYGWIREKLEDAEEEDQQSQLTWTPEIFQTLYHQPGSMHQLRWGPQHIYSRGDKLILPSSLNPKHYPYS